MPEIKWVNIDFYNSIVFNQLLNSLVRVRQFEILWWPKFPIAIEEWTREIEENSSAATKMNCVHAKLLRNDKSIQKRQFHGNLWFLSLNSIKRKEIKWNEMDVGPGAFFIHFSDKYFSTFFYLSLRRFIIRFRFNTT